MKTNEELKQIKEDVTNLVNKMSELTDEELNTVAAGNSDFWDILKKIGEGIENKTKPVVR